MRLDSHFTLLLTTAVLLLAPFAVCSEDLAKMIENTEAFPEVAADNFITQARRPLFKWTSDTEKETAHYPAYINSPKLEFLGFKIWDANIRFQEGKLSSMDLSLYNRGDAGQISDDKFEEIVKSVEQKVSEWMDVKHQEGQRQRLPKNVGWIQNMSWQKGSLEAAMKWSSSKVKGSRDDRPEFLELTIAAAGREKPKVSGSGFETQKDVVQNLKDNIKKEDNGDVWLENVPMVDQGQKGYCAVAVIERILRYYGQEINQHVMAQLADSSAGGGTQTEHMMAMLKRAGTKFRVSVKEHMKSSNSLELQREMEKYNKFRKRKKLPQITPYNGFEQNYMQVKQDFPAFREYKVDGEKTDFKKFRRELVSSIGQGVPLVWGVMLGLCEEEKLNPQAFGGHLRLIVGYNEKTDEIIFSDTWGAGHEAKRMDWGNAWAITTSYSNVFPRK